MKKLTDNNMVDNLIKDLTKRNRLFNVSQKRIFNRVKHYNRTIVKVHNEVAEKVKKFIDPEALKIMTPTIKLGKKSIKGLVSMTVKQEIETLRKYGVEPTTKMLKKRIKDATKEVFKSIKNSYATNIDYRERGKIFSPRKKRYKANYKWMKDHATHTIANMLEGISAFDSDFINHLLSTVHNRPMTWSHAQYRNYYDATGESLKRAFFKAWQEGENSVKRLTKYVASLTTWE